MLDDGLISRFRAGFVPGEPGACWMWQKSLTGRYGQIKLTHERRQTYVHRVAYELAHGEIPAHRQVCHTCDNPLCVNPAHLFVGTSHDNHQDTKKKGRYGECNARAVLTDRQVREIRALLPLVKQWELATRYGVSANTISRIARGVSWIHLI